MQLAILMACHNRREKTVECIHRLQVAARGAKVNYQIVLFDDGSQDHTSEAVQQIEPSAVILKGDGSYFWNRSMHEVFAYALKKEFPAYLWLNDDTMLVSNALLLIQEAVESVKVQEIIVVGALKDPHSGRITYGGGRLIDPILRPFRYVLVEPVGQPEDVDVINGNVVWIPNVVARRLGNLDPIFEHGMGDTDYSMRARKLGIRIIQTAVFVGSCSRNSNEGTYKDRRLPLSLRLHKVNSPIGFPWRSWLTICIRHGGILWPIHFLWAYIKVILNIA